MATEQELYAQVVMIPRNYLNIDKAIKNKNEVTFKFKGGSAKSQRWFDPDFDYIEETFSTREPDLYRKIFQRHDETQDKNIFKMFEVLIGDTTVFEKMKFHSKAPMLKYSQKSLNSCCFSSLASEFHSTNQTMAANFSDTYRRIIGYSSG